MAEFYYVCGHKELRNAAQQWAVRHGMILREFELPTWSMDARAWGGDEHEK